jgi:quercetin dioxygenase-like cupin family protein
MTTQNLTDQISTGDSRPLLVFGEQTTVKVPGEATGGAYTVLEDVSPPGGGPSFLHTHPPHETFYVLEGEYEIYGQNENGKYAIRATPGMAVHVPGGAPHGFKNVGQTVGKMLLVYSPAGIMERFFEEIGTPVGAVANSPDFETIMRVFEKYDIHILEAPPIPASEPPNRAESHDVATQGAFGKFG